MVETGVMESGAAAMPGRLGRVERKARTRQRLLEAAALVIAEKGLAGASLAEIAERAELTTGAVYSNFRSKEALIQAVVTNEMDKLVGALPTEGDTPLSVALTAARMIDHPQVRQLLRAQVELYMLAIRDPELRPEMWERQLEVVEPLARVLASARPRPAKVPPPTMLELAMIFLGTLQGLQQLKLIVPDVVPERLFEWCADLMVTAAQEIEG